MNLKALIEEAVSSREPVIIRRRGRADVALIALDELRGLMETVHVPQAAPGRRRASRRGRRRSY